MKAGTVMTVRDQVVRRVGDKQSVTILAGSEFEKNLWRGMDLPHINVTVLAETVTLMCKEGVLSKYDATASRSVDDAVDQAAGVQRLSAAATVERVYMLTEAGKRIYDRLQNGQDDLQ